MVKRMGGDMTGGVGTPRYMAPELWKTGRYIYDYSVDVCVAPPSTSSPRAMHMRDAPTQLHSFICLDIPR